MSRTDKDAPLVARFAGAPQARAWHALDCPKSPRYRLRSRWRTETIEHPAGWRETMVCREPYGRWRPFVGDESERVRLEADGWKFAVRPVFGPWVETVVVPVEVPDPVCSAEDPKHGTTHCVLAPAGFGRRMSGPSVSDRRMTRRSRKNRVRRLLDDPDDAAWPSDTRGPASGGWWD